MTNIPQLSELNDFLSPVLLVPAKGKTYRIEAVDAETGLRLQKLIAVGVKAYTDKELTEKDLELVSDDEESDFFKAVLGDAYQELLDDKIPYTGLKAIASLAMIWTTQGFEAAEQYFLAGGKVQAPNRATRRTGTPTSTGGASTTRKPASASGMSTRSKAKATPGSKS